MHYGLIVTPFDVLLVNGPFTTMSIVGMVVGALICPPLGLIVSLLFWFSLFTWFPARRRWKLFQAEDVEALRGQRSVLKFPLNECLLQFDDDTLKLTNKLSFKMPPATHSDCMSFVRQGQIFKERLPQGEASA